MDDYEECQQESGSPCTSGGLHMPNSRSMREFAQRVQQQHRHRFYSQCIPDTKKSSAGFSTGSSPGEGSAFPLQVRVRRANSCPEMKKCPAFPGTEANIDKTLEEKEELEESETVLISDGAESEQVKTVVNGKTEDIVHSLQEADISSKEIVLKQTGTQTVDHWSPLPYEHLFLGAFPPVEQQIHSQNGEVKPSPAPLCHHAELLPRFSPYAMLDKYIEVIIQGNMKEDKDAKKSKLQGEYHSYGIIRKS